MKLLLALIISIAVLSVGAPISAQPGVGTHISNITVTPAVGGWLIDWDTSDFADLHGSYIAIWDDVTEPPDRPCPELHPVDDSEVLPSPPPSQCLVTNLLAGEPYQINVRTAFEPGTTITYVAEETVGRRGREIQAKYIVVTPNTDNCFRTGKAFHCPVDDVNHIVGWDIPVVTIMRHQLWETGPYAKAAMIDYGQGLVPQLQGFQGWTFGGTPPVVLNAPDWGYEINVDTGAWISPGGNGVLE